MVDRNRHAAIFLRMLAEKEVRLSRLSMGIFSAQARKVSASYAKDGTQDAIETAKTFEARWFKTLSAHYLITSRAFSKLTAEEIGQDQQAKTYNEVIQEFIINEGLKKSRIINETTIIQIRNIISEGSQEGKNTEDIARRIRMEVGEITSPHRSVAIARTESHRSAAFSQQAFAEDSGVDLEKEWVTTIDGRERSTHRKADGQKRLLKEKFNVGDEELMFPGDGTDGGNNINCRCSIIYHPRGL